MNSQKYKHVQPLELNKWMEKKKSVYLIDTMTNDHYSKTRLPNAVNACVFEISFIDQVKAITENKDAEIVLYGYSDKTLDGATAAEKLSIEGYRKVHLLQGGIQAWRSAGLPLEGDAADDPDESIAFLKLEDRSYRVDTDQSTIKWSGRNPHTTHFGHIKIAKGNLSVKDDIISGIFDIDMNSITNTSLDGDESQPILIGHLKSDDFFFTTLFPTATYNLISAKPVEEPYLSTPNYSIHGALNLRGIESRQDFMATVTNTTENGITVEAHFDIDRTKWNIIYGSTRFFEHLGMHLVFDLISFEVRVMAF